MDGHVELGGVVGESKMSNLLNQYDQALDAAEQLSADEMEALANELLEMAQERRKGPRGKPQSQYGIWKDLPRISEEDIALARKEMWGKLESGGNL